METPNLLRMLNDIDIDSHGDMPVLAVSNLSRREALGPPTKQYGKGATMYQDRPATISA